MGPSTLSSWESVSNPLKTTRASTSSTGRLKQGHSTNDDSTGILNLYVDDVVLEGCNKATLEMIKGKLMSRFKMSDLGRRVAGARNACHP